MINQINCNTFAVGEFLAKLFLFQITQETRTKNSNYSTLNSVAGRKSPAAAPVDFSWNNLFALFERVQGKKVKRT